MVISAITFTNDSNDGYNNVMQLSFKIFSHGIFTIELQLQVIQILFVIYLTTLTMLEYSMGEVLK